MTTLDALKAKLEENLSGSPKKTPSKRKYTLEAERMTEVKARTTGVKFKEDPLFTGFYSFTFRGTLAQSNALRNAIWDLNDGASCEVRSVK